MNPIVGQIVLTIDAAGNVGMKIGGNINRATFNMMFETARQDIVAKFMAQEKAARENPVSAAPPALVDELGKPSRN